jgi:hypothetical protein
MSSPKRNALMKVYTFPLSVVSGHTIKMSSVPNLIKELPL